MNRIVMLIFLAALAPPPQAAAARPIALAEALSLAARRNPDLIAAVERAGGQRARAGADRGLLFPRLSLSSQWTRTDNPSMVFAGKLNAREFTQADFAIDRLNEPDALAHLTTTLGVAVPLDLFGRIRGSAAGQSAYADASDGAVGEAGLELAFRVVEAYRRAELAHRAVRVTEGALAAAAARETEIEARISDGAALDADRLRARTRRRAREADLAERRSDAAIAAATLARLVGEPAGSEPLEAVDPPAAPAPLEGDLAFWTARALELRPALAASRSRRDGTRELSRSEGRWLIPDLALFGNVQDDRNDVDDGAQSWVVGASVAWGFVDAPRKERAEAARAEERAADEEARAVEQSVMLEVETAWRRAQAARERCAAAAGGSEDGREAYRVTRERHAAGKATLTDELETEAASLAAELDELRAAADTAIADAALRRAAGIPEGE